jgi:hypothetical protein
VPLGPRGEGESGHPIKRARCRTTDSRSTARGALSARVPRDLNELGPDWLELGVWLARSLLRYAARHFSKENTVRRDSL